MKVFLFLLAINTVGHAQYAADGTRGTFYSIINGTKNFLEKLDEELDVIQNKTPKIDTILSQLKSVRKTVKDWCDFVENLTDLKTLSLISLVTTVSIITIMQLSIVSYAQIQRFCNK